jgi:hypothetical protein
VDSPHQADQIVYLVHSEYQAGKKVYIVTRVRGRLDDVLQDLGAVDMGKRDEELARLYQLRKAAKADVEGATEAVKHASVVREDLQKSVDRLEEECDEIYDWYKNAREAYLNGYDREVKQLDRERSERYMARLKSRRYEQGGFKRQLSAARASYSEVWKMFLAAKAKSREIELEIRRYRDSL